MTRYCLALDLKDDEKSFAEYKKLHESVWPEVTAAIKKAGINDLEIYQVHSRLFMIMETDESFSFERKWRIDASDAKVQEWEKLMW